MRVLLQGLGWRHGDVRNNDILGHYLRRSLRPLPVSLTKDGVNVLARRLSIVMR